MVMRVLSVFDSASGVFARPIFVASVGAGLRMFGDEVNRVAADNVMNGHPSDFQLFDLGTFDDVAGVFSQSEMPLRIATGSEFKV